MLRPALHARDLKEGGRKNKKKTKLPAQIAILAREHQRSALANLYPRGHDNAQNPECRQGPTHIVYVVSFYRHLELAKQYPRGHDHDPNPEYRQGPTALA